MTAFPSPPPPLVESDRELETISEDVEQSNRKTHELPPPDFQDPITTTPLKPSISEPTKKKKQRKLSYENPIVRPSNLAQPPPGHSYGVLNLYDLRRLEKKHKEALKRNKVNDEEGQRQRGLVRRVRTWKTVLFAVYCFITVGVFISGLVFITLGLMQSTKTCLIVGTLLLFTAFGLCANHCFTQNAGQAREKTLEEKIARQEEHKIMHALAERSRSITQPITVQHDPSAEHREVSPVPIRVQEAAMASAVDSIVSRRLSASMGLGLYADPATKMIMRHGSSRGPRRASMMHLAHSMSMAHHEPWMHGGCRGDDYSEFA